MVVVKKFHPEVRLRALLAQPGGVTVEQALSNAQAELELIREDCMRAIDDKLARLLELAQAANADEDMHRSSNEVLNEAGGFGLDELSNAARSLCIFLDSPADTPARAKIVRIHIDAMRALRQPAVAGDAAAREAVQRGLREVVERHVAEQTQPD